MKPLPLVTSPSNPAIKQARALRRKKTRSQTGLFLVEGLRHVGEALDAMWEIDLLLYSPELLVSDFGRSLIGRVMELPVRLQPVSPKIMESLSEKENPQGILAIVRQRRWAVEALAQTRCSVALVSPQDPGNVGAILRTIDAIRADGLFLLDASVDLYHPTVVRASMGALFWKPTVHTTFIEFVQWAARRRVQLVGTSAHAEVDYRAFTPREPWALIMGSEQKGLSKEQLSAFDATVSLPMRGRGSSLNLAVAAGVLLYAFNR